MAQFYMDPERINESTSLPDAEVFYWSQQDFIQCDEGTIQKEMLKDAMDGGFNNFQAAADLRGWYWWSCIGGSLPDDDPQGPFKTKMGAIYNAREGLIEII